MRGEGDSSVVFLIEDIDIRIDIRSFTPNNV